MSTTTMYSTNPFNVSFKFIESSKTNIFKYYECVFHYKELNFFILPEGMATTLTIMIIDNDNANSMSDIRSTRSKDDLKNLKDS